MMWVCHDEIGPVWQVTVLPDEPCISVCLASTSESGECHTLTIEAARALAEALNELLSNPGMGGS